MQQRYIADCSPACPSQALHPPWFSSYQVPIYPIANRFSHFTSQIPSSFSAYEFLMQPVQKQHPTLLQVSKPRALLSNCSLQSEPPQSFRQSKVVCRIPSHPEELKEASLLYHKRPLWLISLNTVQMIFQEQCLRKDLKNCSCDGFVNRGENMPREDYWFPLLGKILFLEFRAREEPRLQYQITVSCLRGGTAQRQPLTWTCCLNSCSSTPGYTSDPLKERVRREQEEAKRGRDGEELNHGQLSVTHRNHIPLCPHIFTIKNLKATNSTVSSPCRPTSQTSDNQ